METAETTDQAPEQSVMDRVASKFGFPGAAEQQAESTVDAVEAPEPDLFELDFGGEKYQVPVKLKDAFMRQEDYTRKTQALAEDKRSLDQIREIAQTSQMERAFSESISEESQQLSMIDAYLKQASQQDWANMSTDQILRAKLEIDNVKERRDAIKASVDAKRTEFQKQVKARMDELRGKSREIASKKISGFTEETESAIRKYAISEGLSETEIDGVLLDPRSTSVLWKAMQFDQVKAGTTSAAEKATKASPTLKPGAASERMPQSTVAKLNYGKAMKAAGNNPVEKARAIEDRLASVFERRR